MNWVKDFANCSTKERAGMAKARKTRRSVTLDGKITAAQEKVVRMKARYEKSVKTLEALMEKREESRRRELMEAVRKSDHTYEEILCFVRG
jgi:hypothetical protein